MNPDYFCFFFHGGFPGAEARSGAAKPELG
jgi:hypothetical protein